MTEILQPTPVTLPTPTRVEGSHAVRVALAATLPLGPLAVGLLRYVLPYSTTDSSATMVTKVYLDPGAENAVLWLGLVAVLTLVPGILVVIGLLRPHAPRLAAAAAVLLVPGYLSLGVMMASDYLLASAARAGLPQADATRLLAGMHPTAGVAVGIFVVGHVLGTVLLGVACWRTRIVSRVAAAALTISQPLHFVAAVVLGSHLLDLVAWLLTTAAMGALAVVVARRHAR